MKNEVSKYDPVMRFALRAIMFLFTKIFGIKANVPSEVKKLKGPFLLLSNHIGIFDPFVVGCFIKEPVQFVSSDAAFHTPFMRWFLTNLGVIKKKKNIRDSQMIRDLLTVIKRGNAVGIFPEGTRSWTGSTLPIDPSIGKLIKLLNVPVVTAKMKGMQLFNPRWYPKIRPTKVVVDYQLSINSEQLIEFSQEEIVIRILEDLNHDEVNYQKEMKQKIHSSHRAEYINHVLFLCPECRSIGQFRVDRNDFCCAICDNKTHINQYSFFESVNGAELKFDNIRDWFNWQAMELRKFVRDQYESKSSEALFYNDKMVLFEEEGPDFKEFGVGRLSFYINRIVFESIDGKSKELLITDIQTISPQLRERIELFYNGKALRIVGEERGVSGVKWEIATNTIWRLTDEKYKVSSYFNDALIDK